MWVKLYYSGPTVVEYVEYCKVSYFRDTVLF